jgi:trans-aconitate 2-methyltransferase
VNMTVDWDAGTYERVAAPQEEWGRQVIARLRLLGDESVLDAGCGNGKVTALLLERLPNGRMIGVDSSPSMIERAREAFGDDPRVELRVGDLLDLDLTDAVDVVFSTATFHWILNHERLFTRLHAALRPGGRLEAQCGGEGNIAEIQRVLDSLSGDERFSAYLRPSLQPWNFASIGDTETRLRRAGFEVGRVTLEPWPVTPREPRAFLAAAILPWHLDRLPPELRDDFITAVLAAMPGQLTIRYVRLNISARRPA